MLTKLTIRKFKLFDDVEIELSDRVVLVGPNNSGKTSALQAIALWDVGAKRWLEKRGSGAVPEKRPGVTINRRDLLALPVPAANLLWRNLRTQATRQQGGTEKIYVEIELEGVANGATWSGALEFYYANEESFYCRTLPGADAQRTQLPAAAAELRIAYLPPMSGLAPTETRLDEGAINVRMGEGRTAEVLRNLCWQVMEGPDGPARWQAIAERVEKLFGTRLDEPNYVSERGEITLSSRNRDGIRLDISSSGRGEQQTLLLLAHMAAHPGSVLLLDEPDAHLEVLRQRQIYQVITETAAETGSQIIAASHSEVILNEAADRDTVVAFVGRPHRIDDRGSQVLKALKEIGFEHYVQAEEQGWVLYLEGSTDLAILRAFAKRLEHRAADLLERPFVHYVLNQPSQARHHFHGLRDAKPDLVGLALYDRLDGGLQDDSYLRQEMWHRREIENYLCQEATLLAWAEAAGRKEHGDLFAESWRDKMESLIRDRVPPIALRDPTNDWWRNTKVSDDFLAPLFQDFYTGLKLPNLMHKTDYHTLAPFVSPSELEGEVGEKLDAIVEVAERATPAGSNE